LQGSVAIGNIVCKIDVINELPYTLRTQILPPAQVPRANAFRLRSRRLLKRSHNIFSPLFLFLLTFLVEIA
jgi:hypothetical protein